MEVNERIEKSRKLQVQLNECMEEVASIDERLAECRHRLNFLCSRGRLRAKEAISQFEGQLEHLAEEGKQRLHYAIGEFTKPRHHNPGLISDRYQRPVDLGQAFRGQLSGGVRPVDVSAIVYLLRDEIRADGKALIQELCKGSEMPSEAERYDEVDKLGKEVGDLETEKIELQKQAARLLKSIRDVLGAIPGEGSYVHGLGR